MHIAFLVLLLDHSVCHESLLASFMYSRLVVLQTLHHVPESHYGINLYFIYTYILKNEIGH